LTVNLLRKLILTMFAMTAAASVYGQQGQWAAADNPTAKFMIDAERKWAEAACTHDKIAQTILAEDFQGTSPEGQRYTKSEEVSDTEDTSKNARDCRLIDLDRHMAQAEWQLADHRGARYALRLQVGVVRAETWPYLCCCENPSSLSDSDKFLVLLVTCQKCHHRAAF
jgi:hypothetical protein